LRDRHRRISEIRIGAVRFTGQTGVKVEFMFGVPDDFLSRLIAVC
jgi:hypothetical protein